MYSNNYLRLKFALCLASLLLLVLPTIMYPQGTRARRSAPRRNDFKAAADAAFNEKTYDSDIAKLTKLLNANPTLVKQQNEKGETLLHLAVRGKDAGIVELLLARKSDVNARDRHNATPLYNAISSSCIECATILLANQADPSVKAYKGNNLIHAAASYPTAEPLKYILPFKLDVNARNDAGQTPLMEAAGRGYRNNDENVELLIANQADVTLKNKKGQTALHLAADRWGADAIKMLLAKNLDVNAKDEDGNTPLLLLAGGGASAAYTVDEAVKGLLDAKADVNAQNNLGETALFRACKSGLSELVEVLLANKADPSLKTRDGRSPSCPSTGRDSN